MTFVIALAVVVIMPMIVRLIGYPVGLAIGGMVVAAVIVRARAGGVPVNFDPVSEKLERVGRHWSYPPFFNPELSTLENLAAHTARTLVFAASLYVAFHLAGYVL